MKKFFKFFAVALVAGCMFTACGEKENNGENNGEGNGNGNGTAGANTYTIGIEGQQSWTAANTMFIDYTAEQYVTVYAFKVANSQDDVYVQGFLETVSGDHTYESTSGDCMNYYDPTQLYTDVDGALGQGAGAQFYKWQSKKDAFTEHITSCDLNTLTMNCTWNQPLFNIENYVAAQGQSYGDLVNLKGEMKDYKFTLTPAQK